MGVSLKDVALRAGVSVKTVSNVVNDYPYVSATTRARVRQAVEELGYRPNLSARHLRTGRSGIIALAVPELGNPYFAEVAGAVIDAAAEHQLTVLLDHTAGLRAKEALVSQGFRSQVIDGLILSPIQLETEDLLTRAEGPPLVLLGEREYDAPFDHIAIDNVAAARTAVRHLLDLGRRRIAFLGARHESRRQPAHLRLRGWYQEITAAGWAAQESLVVATRGFDRRDGATAMTELLDRARPPDAVFAYNDVVALGAMRVLSERGLRVPEDIAVVGFDDIEEGRYAPVSLTTVAPDKSAIARLAVDCLVERIATGGSETPPAARRILPGYRLVVRESTVGRVDATGTATVPQPPPKPPPLLSPLPLPLPPSPSPPLSPSTSAPPPRPGRAPPGETPDRSTPATAPPRQPLAHAPRNAMPRPTLARHPFGTAPDGQAVDRWTLDSGTGVRAEILTFGGVLHGLHVPDPAGRSECVVLNLPSVGDYAERSPYFGALVGRFANRVADGRFTLDGQPHRLSVNDRGNTLHGGTDGFHRRVWAVDDQAPRSRPDSEVSLRLSLRSPHGDMGFPGTLEVSARYTLDRSGALRIDFQARTDRPTVVNLTSHSYFNLTGAGSGDVLDHTLALDADAYLPVSADAIPLGPIADTADTPFDFVRPHRIGDRIAHDHPQLRDAGGYDHCWVLTPPPDAGALRRAARLADPRSGRRMEVWTTEPGIQLYTGNALDGSLADANGRTYPRHAGLCLETQHLPDSPNRPEYPSTELRPGATYRSSTELRFPHR
jgi:DNA-binding LacI/PurR family transcriptional regulator/galactose mutarotase-like enzyme